MIRYSINLIEDRDNRLLMLKRSEDVPQSPGLWSFPGGHAREGEAPLQCARRELEEEIGERVQLTLRKTLGPFRRRCEGEDCELHLFHWTWLGGTPSLNVENQAFDWVAKEDYRRYPAMARADESILLLSIWPQEFLHG